MDASVLRLPSDVTAEWLGLVLGIAVAVVSIEPLESGLVSPIARIRLRGEGGPASVIVKCAPPDEARRTRLRALGKTECRFYRDIGGEAGIPVPHCWHAEYSDADDNYTLVLEDLYPRVPGLPEPGLTYDQVECATVQLASMHARHWQRADRWPWLAERFDTRLESLISTVGPIAADAGDRYRDSMPASVVDALPRAATTVSAAARRVREAGELTLVHGDFDGRNIAFGEDPSDLVVFDWQAVMMNSPATDLVKLIVGSLTVERRRAVGERLLRTYRDRMLVGGLDLSEESIREFVHDGLFERLLTGLLIMMGTDRGSLTERTILLAFARVGAALDDGW